MIRMWVLPLLLLSACATTVPEPQAAPDLISGMVWPAAPEPARIKQISTFSSARDLGYKESISRKFGKFFAGTNNYGMIRPYAIAVDANLVAVADPGLAAVHLFDKNRKSYRLLMKIGGYNFESPISIALSSDRLFIADSSLEKVFILDRRLKLKSVLEGFQRPTSVTRWITRCDSA